MWFRIKWGTHEAKHDNKTQSSNEMGHKFIFFAANKRVQKVRLADSEKSRTVCELSTILGTVASEERLRSCNDENNEKEETDLQVASYVMNKLLHVSILTH
jgi:hypothetical protein